MGNKLVLLIEDNIDDERLTLRALRKNNIMNEVVVAYDGEEALDYLFARGSYAGRDTEVMPAVVILDLKLPKVDGHEVLAKIKEDESLRRIHVVILTTSNAERDRLKAYDLHANSYVVKPLDFASFTELIKDLSLYWGVWNEKVAE